MEDILPQAFTYDLCLNPWLQLMIRLVSQRFQKMFWDSGHQDKQVGQEQHEETQMSASDNGQITSVHPLNRYNIRVDYPPLNFNTGIPINGAGALDFANGIKVNLHLITGDIIDLANTDSIVNFVYDEDIYGRMGIMQAAGDAVKQEYNKNRLQEDLPHVRYGVIKTTAGNLSYRAIFHIHVFEQPAKFENAIYKALQLADRSGMRSIAFPALANPKYVDSYLEIFYEFEKRARPRCLHMIDIVANNQKEYEHHDIEMGKRGEDLFR